MIFLNTPSLMSFQSLQDTNLNEILIYNYLKYRILNNLNILLKDKLTT